MTKMVKALVLVAILTTTLAVSPAQACACGVPDWSTMSDEEIVSTINNAEDEPRIMSGQGGALPPAPAGYRYDANYMLVPLSVYSWVHAYKLWAPAVDYVGASWWVGLLIIAATNVAAERDCLKKGYDAAQVLIIWPSASQKQVFFSHFCGFTRLYLASIETFQTVSEGVVLGK